MAPGDRVFYYHTGDEKAIVGTARVAGAPYPDPASADGSLYAVDLTCERAAARAGHAEGRQGRPALRRLRAHARAAPVGDAGDRRAVDDADGDGES